MRTSSTLLIAALFSALDSNLVTADDGSRIETPLRGSFLSIGLGMGSIVSSDSDDDSGMANALRLGQALSPNVHLVEQVALKYGSPDREVATGYGLFAAGVRWTPFHGSRQAAEGPITLHRFVDLTALYLEAAAGLGIRERTANDAPRQVTYSYGPAGRFAVGYLALQGYDYAFGMELDCTLARYDGTLVATSNMLLVVQLRH